jgi:soluble lytic murein transglycosylase
MAALGAADAFSDPLQKHVPPDRSKAVKAAHQKRGSAPEAKRSEGVRQGQRNRAAHPVASSIPLPVPRPKALDAAVPPLPAEPPLPPPPPLSAGLAAAKQAVEAARRGKAKDAAALAASSGDPVVAKLVEWALLRPVDSEAGFDRYLAFIRANPAWPSMSILRRRAETRLWQERRDAATVRRFVGEEPTSALGRLALARVEIGEGNRAAAESKVRAVWHSAQLSAEQEAAVLAAFPDVLTRADHVTRMDGRIGAKDFGAALRAAKHVGDNQVAIVKACTAAEAKAAKGGALLNAVPANAREDLGYALCRLHWLLRNDTPGSNLHGRIVTPKEEISAAVKLTLAAAKEDLQRQDTDEWWRERRALVRKLIDLGDAATAYQVALKSAPPANPYYRAEVHFMAGWIALRFLADPARALEHFAHVDDGSADPIVLARAAYWRGRAAEAAGQPEEMRAHYEAAARHPTAY